MDERDRRIAALERDLDELRALLVGYIDEREMAEVALAESETRYRQLIDRAAFGIYRASSTGRFLEVNAALVAMLGYASDEQLLGVDMGRDVYADAAERDGVMAHIRSGAPADWLQVRWRRKDGSPITVRLSARLVRDDGGRELFCEAIAEDVTERNRRDALLRRSERMASLGHTLAGVAHELNNPLAAVSGFAQLMLREARSEEDRTALETINREATRAGKIVKDLLTFARRQEAHPHEPVQVAEVARHIFATQRYAMETRGIRQELVVERDLPPVLADAAQIEQVLLNLVVNARQAIEAATEAPAGSAAAPADPPTISLHARRDGGGVVIEVADTGVGIAMVDRERIWDPFWSSKEEGQGTGLGLAVVHGLVTAHGGTIEVDSEAGRGTRFVIRLPAAGATADGAAEPRADGGAGAAPAERGAARPPRPLDILLVEDEESLLGFLHRFFSSRGHAVMVASDAAQALRIGAQATFDVVICGLRSPGPDGCDVVERLRAMPTCAEARYVVAAGSARGARVASVAKPYAIDELRRAVEDG